MKYHFLAQTKMKVLKSKIKINAVLRNQNKTMIMTIFLPESKTCNLLIYTTMNMEADGALRVPFAHFVKNHDITSFYHDLLNKVRLTQQKEISNDALSEYCKC